MLKLALEQHFYAVRPTKHLCQYGWWYVKCQKGRTGEWACRPCDLGQFDEGRQKSIDRFSVIFDSAVRYGVEHITSDPTPPPYGKSQLTGKGSKENAYKGSASYLGKGKSQSKSKSKDTRASTRVELENDASGRPNPGYGPDDGRDDSPSLKSSSEEPTVTAIVVAEDENPDARSKTHERAESSSSDDRMPVSVVKKSSVNNKMPMESIPQSTKRSASSSAAVTGSEWSCETCDQRNTADAVVCEFCDKPRDAPAPWDTMSPEESKEDAVAQAKRTKLTESAIVAGGTIPLPDPTVKGDTAPPDPPQFLPPEPDAAEIDNARAKKRLVAVKEECSKENKDVRMRSRVSKTVEQYR